jgi:hypothetical protein
VFNPGDTWIEDIIEVYLRSQHFSLPVIPVKQTLSLLHDSGPGFEEGVALLPPVSEVGVFP